MASKKEKIMLAVLGVPSIEANEYMGRYYIGNHLFNHLDEAAKYVDRMENVIIFTRIADTLGLDYKHYGDKMVIKF